MRDATERALRAIAQQEQRYRDHAPAGARLPGQDRIPAGLRDTLTAAFAKGFHVVFARGTGLIEKTYDRELLEAEFQVQDGRSGAHPTRRSLRRLDRRARQVRMTGSGTALAEGVGLGALGIGLPDVPLFLAGLLRGIYQIALSYGFSYDTPEERAYLLRLLACAAAPGRDAQQALDALARGIQAGTAPLPDLEAETARAADGLADLMLTAKFIQGLPLVGAVGGALNLPVYRRLTAYAALEYRKRYLWRRQKGGMA